jgi:hypothetical protein
VNNRESVVVFQVIPHCYLGQLKHPYGVLQNCHSGSQSKGIEQHIDIIGAGFLQHTN